MKTTKLFKLNATLATMFLVVLQANALTSWETTQITQKADPLAQEVTAVYRFENIGDKPMTIIEVKSSCGCTTAELEKKTYAPGEKGEIRAILKIGSRQGLQTKTVRVTTDSEDQPTILTMKTLIPEIMEIKPAFVFWMQEEVPDIKTIDLKIGLKEKMHVVKATSDSSLVGVELEEVEPGKLYRLNLFPTGTDAPAKARITIETDYPKDNPKTFYVYAHVK